MVERWREKETSPGEHQNTLCFFSGVFLLHLCSHKQIFSLQRVFFCCSGAQGRHKVQQTISLLHQTHGEIQHFPVLGTFLVILHKSTFPALQRTRKKEVSRWGLKWFVSTGAPKPDWEMSRGAFELKILPDVAKESKKKVPRSCLSLGKNTPTCMHLYQTHHFHKTCFSLCDVSQTESDQGSHSSFPGL